jgi:hypothetical protein
MDINWQLFTSMLQNEYHSITQQHTNNEQRIPTLFQCTKGTATRAAASGIQQTSMS